jgi:hypothetical protein
MHNGMKHILLIISSISIILMIRCTVYAADLDISGQLSGWISAAEIREHWEAVTGLRYIPRTYLKHDLRPDSDLDMELSLNCYAITGSGPYEDDSNVDLYRANVRYMTIQTETQLGLQKIDFGPAHLLRSLRWFDRLDPTDPLELTEGVRALRFRYDALNNANFRIWGLYDNDDTKGYETLPTVKDTIEPGGRLQYPLWDGDVAVTFHSRKVDGSAHLIPAFRENRYALDGRWDVEIGLWFEAVLQQQKTPFVPFEYEKRTTLGADYTFDVGNGLYLLMEHMIVGLSNEATGWDDVRNISAFSMSYPLGIMDNMKTVGYYYWEQSKYYQHLIWTRNYDAVTFSLSVSYAPVTPGANTGKSQDFDTGEWGGRLMVIFNH